MSDPIQIGILGGGQLAMMLAEAARHLNLKIQVCEEDPLPPARYTSAQIFPSRIEKTEQFRAWLSSLDVLTFENEFVDTNLLREIIPHSLRAFPSLESLSLIQDKLFQKEFLRKNNLPLPDFQAVDRLEQAVEFAERTDWPIVLKTRRLGYDGKGTFVLKERQGLEEFSKSFEAGKLVAERFVPFRRELAIQVARNAKGEIAFFPVVETFQDQGICRWVKAPAPIPASRVRQIEALAQKIMEELQAVGLFAVELFETISGEILINELAPRVHNSGHYTIEGCNVSQFEQHLRAITGKELVRPVLSHPAVAMVNFLGEFEGEYTLEEHSEIWSRFCARIHWYHKVQSKQGRKMGHVTAWGEDLEQAYHNALKAKQEFKICPKHQSL